MSWNRLFTKGIRNPWTALKFLKSPKGRNFIGQKINQFYHSRGGIREYNPEGIDIFEEDWDNLIILDACRYDSFVSAKERHNLSGELESRISRGSQTPEWLWANFRGRDLSDTVYISASGMPQHIGVDNSSSKSRYQEKYSFNLKVHDLINVWSDPPDGARPTVEDGRTSDHLVPAGLMANKAIEFAKKYPNKRILIHIIEPHDPYYGTEIGKEIHKKSRHPWKDKLQQKIDTPVEKLRQAYQQNVDIGVKAASALIEELVGKTVVSSDHGEMLWERSNPVPTVEILHPDKTYIDELVRVPWLIVDGERRDITSGTPITEDDNISDMKPTSTTEEQLKALGYRD